MLFLVSMLQAVSSTPPETIDLTIRQPCEQQRAAGDEVIVCAQRNGDSPYRLNQPPPAPRELPKAKVQIAQGVEASAEAEQADVGGFQSRRAMIRLKIKF